MASSLKKTGVTGSLLCQMAERGGVMTSDHRGFPPSKRFLPLLRRGLAELRREPACGRTRYNIWHVTPKGWAALGLKEPADQI